MSNYAVTVTGTTYDGSTSRLQQDTTFTPAANFTEQGLLAVVPTVDTAGASGNDVNVVDLGLYVGNPFAVTPDAGSLSWASNSALHVTFLHANQSQTADVDDTNQSFDPNTRTLRAVVDPNIAPAIQLNEFDKTGGLLGFPSPILAGEIDVTFSADNSSVSGKATFYGGGYIEPTTTAWSATFTGTLVS
jgi:hypothetical protein